MNDIQRHELYCVIVGQLAISKDVNKLIDKILPIGQRDQPKLGEGGGEAALAIGEHAFRAGFYAGASFADSGAGHAEEACETAWSAYEPSEEIKELS